MKKISFIFIFFLVFLAFTVNNVFASCRCGRRLVSIGDLKVEVIAKCGPPTWTEERKEERIERIYNNSYYKDGELREPLAAKVEVDIEEWLYNFGPNRLIRILKFENGRLVEIETGGYGY